MDQTLLEQALVEDSIKLLLKIGHILALLHRPHYSPNVSLNLFGRNVQVTRVRFLPEFLLNSIRDEYHHVLAPPEGSGPGRIVHLFQSGQFIPELPRENASPLLQIICNKCLKPDLVFLLLPEGVKPCSLINETKDSNFGAGASDEFGLSSEGPMSTG